MKFVVQEYVTRERGSNRDTWADINGPWDQPFGEAHLWEADSAPQAFQKAVFDNPRHQIKSTSYRVLYYEEGMTFNVGINVDQAKESTEAKVEVG